MPWQSFKEKSRTNYGREFCGGESQNVTWQEIRDGCLMRITDGIELMAKNHSELIRERDRYERDYDRKCEYARGLERRIASLRGYITKLKKAK